MEQLGPHQFDKIVAAEGKARGDAQVLAKVAHHDADCGEH